MTIKNLALPPYPERMPVTRQHVGAVLSSTAKRWREFLLHVETDQYGNTNAYLQRQRVPGSSA